MSVWVTASLKVLDKFLVIRPNSLLSSALLLAFWLRVSYRSISPSTALFPFILSFVSEIVLFKSVITSVVVLTSSRNITNAPTTVPIRVIIQIIGFFFIAAFNAFCTTSNPLVATLVNITAVLYEPYTNANMPSISATVSQCFISLVSISKLSERTPLLPSAMSAIITSQASCKLLHLPARLSARASCML